MAFFGQLYIFGCFLIIVLIIFSNHSNLAFVYCFRSFWFFFQNFAKCIFSNSIFFSWYNCVLVSFFTAGTFNLCRYGNWSSTRSKILELQMIYFDIVWPILILYISLIFMCYKVFILCRHDDKYSYILCTWCFKYRGFVYCKL